MITMMVVAYLECKIGNPSNKLKPSQNRAENI